MSETEQEVLDRLKALDQNMGIIKSMLADVINYAREAESEIPEKMRRFANYFHDVVHIKGEYVSLGLASPKYIEREMERCDDRMRQLLDELHHEDGAFGKVRRKMADDPANRWDHTRQISKPEVKHETGSSIQQQDGIDKG